MKNLKKNWFTYFFLIYSLFIVVDRLLYWFWDIGTNEAYVTLVMWICLLPMWIYLLQENKKTPADAPSETPDATPPEDDQ
tara:strand:- start:112 stop:351 length:240 start_codon:yes stop_codon:yes gene_type:complete